MSEDEADVCARRCSTEGVVFERSGIGGEERFMGLPVSGYLFGAGLAGHFSDLSRRSMYVTSSLRPFFVSKVSKNPGEGGGASVCLRRKVFGETPLDKLLRASELLLRA